jgi:hypothetical protein
MRTSFFHATRDVYLAIPAALGAAALGAAGLGVAPVAHADVTIEQKTTLDVASMIKMHGGSTTNVTADKQREDTESHCEGMMSLICGNVKSGDIVRLDRGVTWRLQPDKKTYREEVFATPEELAEMRAKMQATLEKMRSCPVSQKQQPIDKSKCEMSPPKIDVHKTDDKATIAGHDTQRTLATLTETCTNKDTGDVCDTVVAVDLWLTQDNVPGAADRRAFAQAYAKKLGLDDVQGPLRGEFAKFLAPYQSQIKQLTDKSSDFKGQPMKTSLRVLMGGPQCSASAKMKDNASQSGDGSAGGNPMGDVGQAGKAIGSMLGGLFHKKKTDDSDATASGAAPASSATPSSDPYSQYAQLATFTMETVTINTDAIPSERFEVPPGWTKEVPPPSKKGDSDFTCPKTGS